MEHFFSQINTYAIFAFPVLALLVIYCLFKAFNFQSVTFKTYNLFEIIGKAYVLFAVCIQLTAVSTLTAGRNTLTGLEYRERHNLERLELTEIRSGILLHDIEERVRANDIKRMMASSFTLNSMAIEAKTDLEMRSLQESIDNLVGGYNKEENRLSALIEEVNEITSESEDIRKDVKKSRTNIKTNSKNVDKLGTIWNRYFLAWFLSGSLVILIARVYEIKSENETA